MKTLGTVTILALALDAAVEAVKADFTFGEPYGSAGFVVDNLD